MFRPSMRALISWSLGLPLLIILDSTIQGCSVEKRRTRTVLCVQDQCPNLPKVTRKKKKRMRGHGRVRFGVFPHHLFAMLVGKGKATLQSTWS